MRRLLRTITPLALVVAAALPLSSQQSNAPAPADPIIRVTVGLVQIDAVVTDSKGNHVADLKPEDFEVLEDGKRQTITHFSYIRSTTAPTTAQPVKPAKGTSKETLRLEAEIVPGPSRQLRANEVRRLLVLVADNLGISAENIPRVRSTMKNFVDNQMQPGDLVSVVTTAKGMGPLNQFTNDKRQLHAAIDRVRWVSYGRNGVSTFEPINEEPVPDDPVEAQMMQDQKDFEQAAENTRSDNMALGTMGTLNYIVQGLKELPGRKAVVLFSQGFAFYRTPTVDRIPGTTSSRGPDYDDRTQTSARKLTDLANRAGAVIYSFDVRGLPVTNLSAADRVAPNPRNPSHLSDLQRDRTNTYQDSQDGMEFLAKETGGLFFHENKDFNTGLAKTIDDLSGYYLIGYQPQRAADTGDKAKATFHKIQVHVKKSGLHVRSRNGYLGEPDTVPVLKPEDARKVQISKALFSPFQNTDVRIKLSPYYSGVAKSDGGRKETIMRAVVHIDIRDLDFQDVKDAKEPKKRAVIDVVCAAYDGESKAAGSSDKTFTIEATPKQIENTVPHGIDYQFDIPIPKPGAYQVRAAVRDAQAERVGSFTTFVQIPDFNGPKLALSSMVLYEQADPDKSTAALQSQIAGAGSGTTRVFAPGVSLGYATYAFNGKLDPATSKPKLEVEVRLYHGNQRIFASKPLPMIPPADPSKTAGAVPAMGRIKIPTGMAAGDYSVVLIVYDRAVPGPKPAFAVQTTDFTLVNPEAVQPSAARN